MDWTLLLVFQALFQPSLSVLFTVEAERTAYASKFGEAVVMGCRFQPKLAAPDAELKVAWHFTGTDLVREVYQYQWDVNPEPSAPQEAHSRVKLLTNQLQDGWARLQISSLRINDSGTYQCLVQTREGADYKTMTLSVTAPYTEVAKSIEEAADGDKVLLTCQSEGYPETPVAWQDGHLRAISPNTSAVKTHDHLFKVTSQILVTSSDKNNYTCDFTNDRLSATFSIPDDLPAAEHDAVVVLLSVGLVVAIVVTAVLLYRRRKGFRTVCKRNLLADERVTAGAGAAYLQIEKEEEEKRPTFSEDQRQENLRAFLKERYCRFQCAADVEELHHRLRNNEGQSVNLQALIPEAGEAVFVEGPPGSGKTSVAYVLVSSWTEGPTHALSNSLNLNILRLLLYLDCTAVEADLCQEIIAQLSLKETTWTENELRTMLTASSETLLLLDGYSEGNAHFDESLNRLLSERGGCRVLVMTSQEPSLLLKQTARTARQLKLQTQIVKY